MAAPSASERFGLIIDGMCREAAAQASKRWVIAPLVLVLWRYLRRLAVRFDRLLARYQSGRLTTPPPRPPRAELPRPGRQRLPGGFGWLLLHFGPAMAAYASQLQHLLAEPEMATLLVSAPRAGRMLRPLRRMLGHATEPPPKPAPAIAHAPPDPTAPIRPAAAGTLAPTLAETA